MWCDILWCYFCYIRYSTWFDILWWSPVGKKKVHGIFIGIDVINFDLLLHDLAAMLPHTAWLSAQTPPFYSSIPSAVNKINQYQTFSKLTMRQTGNFQDVKFNKFSNYDSQTMHCMQTRKTSYIPIIVVALY